MAENVLKQNLSKQNLSLLNRVLHMSHDEVLTLGTPVVIGTTVEALYYGHPWDQNICP